MTRLAGRARTVAQAIALSVALGLAGCQGAANIAGPGEVPGGTSAAKLEDAASALRGEWRLVSLLPGDAPAIPVPASGQFSADFRADGGLHIMADCNSCRGEYTAGAGTLQVSPLMACTRAYCLSAPVDTRFTAMVQEATTWVVTDETLQIEGPGGRVSFRR